MPALRHLRCTRNFFVVFLDYLRSREEWTVAINPMLLGFTPAVPTTEERELARCTFKPKINPSLRPSTAPPSRPRPRTSEELELASSCTFNPKFSSVAKPGGKALWQLQAESMVKAPRIIRPALVHGEHSISAEELAIVAKFVKPHDLLIRVFDMVLIILQEEHGSWHHTLQQLADPYRFLIAVANIKKERIEKKTLKLLYPYLVAPDVSLAHARSIFPALPGVCLLLDWVLFMADLTPAAWRRAHWFWKAEPALPWKIIEHPVTGIARVAGTSTWQQRTQPRAL